MFSEVSNIVSCRVDFALKNPFLFTSIHVRHLVSVARGRRYLGSGRATMPTPTAVSNKVVSLEAAIFPSIRVRALVLQSALFARKLSLVTIER